MPTLSRLCALAFTLLLTNFAAAAPTTFHVSTTGSDAWPGTEDSPFLTLARARDAVRLLRVSGRWPAEGVAVVIHPGTYALTASLKLGAEDSGRPGAPVIWRAAEPRQVVLSGGVRVVGFAPVTDAAVRARLPAGVRDQVRVIDLRAQGVTDLGTIAQRGSPGLELFCGGRRMPLARYPNTGWLLIDDVPQTGPRRLNEGLEREKRFDGVPVGRHYGRIRYPGDRPSAWAPSDDIYLHGYWTWDWSDSYQRVASIDPAAREITLAEPHHHYGYTKNQRFRVLNVLEELDEPGEWQLDRASGRIYFLPPAPTAGSAVVSLLEGPLVALDGAENVRLEGLGFEAGRGSGVVVKGGRAVTIAGCGFRLLGGEAVTIDGGTGHTVASCDFHDLALGAIRLVGGDRRTLEPSGHTASNNHIHDFSVWLRTGQYGVFIDGVGHRVLNNLIHDAPFEAMYLRGNDHLVEFNEVHGTMRETGDAGAIHTGRDYTWRGNVIRHNYWHDLRGPGLHGVTAVYLDDFASGFEVTGNIFYRAGRATQIGGGRDNIVTNNLYVECQPAVHVDARALSWAHYYFDGTYTWVFDRFRELKADQPPYADRYPVLRTLLQDQPAVPKGNVITGNISWGSGRFLDVYDYHAFDFHGLVVLRDNFIGDTVVIRRRAAPDAGGDPYYLNIDGTEGYEHAPGNSPAVVREFAGNVVTPGAAGTFDPVTLRFTPADPALPARLGFKPIPVERIGLQRDEWRRDVPPRTAVPSP